MKGLGFRVYALVFTVIIEGFGLYGAYELVLGYMIKIQVFRVCGLCFKVKIEMG